MDLGASPKGFLAMDLLTGCLKNIRVSPGRAPGTHFGPSVQVRFHDSRPQIWTK